MPLSRHSSVLHRLANPFGKDRNRILDNRHPYFFARLIGDVHLFYPTAFARSIRTKGIWFQQPADIG